MVVNGLCVIPAYAAALRGGRFSFVLLLLFVVFAGVAGILE